MRDNRNFLVLVLNACTIMVLTSFAGANEERFLAVTSLVGSERFYIEPWFLFYEGDDLSPESQREICEDIVRSPFFNNFYRVSLVDPSDIDEMIHLKEKYPRIYEDLYVKQQNSSKEAVLTNPYRSREVVVGNDVVHEDTFTCLGIDRRTKTIIEYFVSPTHLVTDDRTHDDKMKGVFVFAYNDNKEQINVIALAEQPGFAISASHRLFNESVMSGFKIQIAGVHDELNTRDTLCALTVHQKIRMCTLVLNAVECRNEVMFFPHKDNVDPQCYRGVITFQKSTAGTEVEQTDDWLVGCKAVSIGNKTPATYYVSAGFESLDYVVCIKPTREKIILGGISCRANASSVRKTKFLPLTQFN